MTWLRRIIVDPLTHFLAIGVAILLAASLVDRGTPIGDEGRQIIVDREALLTFMQYRSNSFEPEAFDALLSEMSETDRNELLDDYVKNEVLLREAVALGLDRSDGVIRGRLQQRMEFALKGLIAETEPLSEDAFASYFQENIETYRIAQSITFTHIFFSANSGSSEEAEGRVVEALERIETTQDTMTLGDRFPYFVHYVDRTPDLVSSHFGNDFAAKVFDLRQAPDLWQGPIQSPYGLHLVQVSSNKPSRLPQIEEVRTQVTEDATRANIDQRLDRTIQELAATYQVTIDLSEPVIE